ncbi:MAG: OpgC domain-containing protein [Rhodobacteraceae bacterium]|nr:OpgC domain-containing protein [Paracoccaceae bacterium]
MPETPHLRDFRIDLLRGIALVMIFINHVPGTIWENFTSRNFGFSDAAEAFVLMSGIATGLAYGPAFLRGRPKLAEALRPWRRAVTLWWVHVLAVFCIVALFALTIDQPGVEAMAQMRSILPAVEHPAAMMAPLVLLGHHFAYADILPLYVVLMVTAPAILFFAAHWPKSTMVGSLLLWLVVGVLSIKMPTWPTDYGWFFNPMAWQVLFVAGVLTGLAMRRGQRFLPVRHWPLRLAMGFVVAAAVWVQVPLVANWGGHGLWLLYEYASVPSIFTSFNKSVVSLPRLLHILALAYVVSAWPSLKTLAASPRLGVFVLLGRHSLPVFATSTVLAYIAQVTKAVEPVSVLFDTLLIATGICILVVVAHVRERQRIQGTGPLLKVPNTSLSAI